MSKQKNRRWLLPLLCYAVAILLWFAVGGVALLRDTLYTNNGRLWRQELDFYDFDDQFGLLAPEDFTAEPWFASTDPDPQLILRFAEGRYVTRFVFAGKPVNHGSGEMVLYYTTSPDDGEPGDGFSERKKLWAAQDASGAWVFDTGGKTLYALRFDPASYAGVYWDVERMVLNEAKPAWQYFVPDGLQAALLLFLPLLAWAFLREVMAFTRPAFARRRFDARWQKETQPTPGAAKQKPPAKAPTLPKPGKGKEPPPPA